MWGRAAVPPASESCVEPANRKPTSGFAPERVRSASADAMGHSLGSISIQPSPQVIQCVKMTNSAGKEIEVSERAINSAFHRKMVDLTHAWNQADDPTVVKHNLMAEMQPTPGLHAPTPTVPMPASTPEERFHTVRRIKHFPFSNFDLTGPGGLTGSARINTFPKGSRNRTTHDYFLEGESDEGGSYIAVGKSFQALMDATGKSRREIAQAHLELLHGRVPDGFTPDQLNRMNEHVNIFSIAEPRRDVGMFLHSYIALHNMAHDDSPDFDPEASFGHEEVAPPPKPKKKAKKKDDKKKGKKKGKKKAKDESSDSEETPKKKKKPKLIPGTFAPAFKGSKAPLDEFEEEAEVGKTITSHRKEIVNVRSGFHKHIKAYFEGMDFRAGGRDTLPGADFEDEDAAAEAAATQAAEQLFGGTTVLTPPAVGTQIVRPSSPTRRETEHVLSTMTPDQLGRTLPNLAPDVLFPSLLPPTTTSPPQRPPSPQRRFSVKTLDAMDEDQMTRSVDEMNEEAFERLMKAYKLRKSKRKRSDSNADDPDRETKRSTPPDLQGPPTGGPPD